MGPETGASKVKGEGGVDVKQGEEDELVVSVSALDKLWQGSERGGTREAHGHEHSDSAAFSPVEAEAEGSDHGGSGELRRPLEGGRFSFSEEVFCELR